MADIKPFCAIRYSQENITNFICPSYDTISPSEKERLQKLSQFNIVNIEFPDQVSKNNKYKNTSELLHLWQDEGVLVHDDIPAFYFYEQVFNDHGIKMTRRGFFAALKLENFYSQEGSIKFYEKIFSKSKADRLSLLKATKINISPVFGLFDDECRIVVDICKKIAKRNISAVAKDKDGVFHKLWAVDDNNIVKTLEKYLLNKKIFITDGCHRYETAWNYSQERKEKDKHYSQYSDYNYVMSYLCPMEDPGISIWAIHRVIEAPDNLEANIEKYFDVYLVKDFQKLSKKEVQPIIIFKDGKYRVLMIKKDDFLKKAMPKKSRACRNLAVSVLHYVLMPNIEASEFTYVKDDKEAILLARKTGKMAIMVPPTPMQSLKDISLSNEIMPQKSIYFYPKLSCGIVMLMLNKKTRCLNCL